MRTTRILTIVILLIGCTRIASAEVLFSDDFEAGLQDYWVVSHLDGEPAWEVVVEDGSSVLKVDASGGAWTIASVDSVASLGENDELWTTCKIKLAGSIDSCGELGLLTIPDEPNGNWYLATCEGGQEVGIDECAVVWHSRTSFEWGLDTWYNMKVMVSGDGVMSGKMWPEGGDEPMDWLTQETLATHLDEDGIGVAAYNAVIYWDDIIVSTDESSLVIAAIDASGKLPAIWGSIKLVN